MTRSSHDGVLTIKTLLKGYVDVSRETMALLELYHDLLLRWQKAQNLVAPNTLSEVWQRHFADSAQLIPFLGDGKSLIDMGSGAGFPGLVLAILKKDDASFNVHLIEANGRKCAFLKDVVRETAVNVEIHNCRIEDFANQSTIPSIDVVTARALKPLHQLIDFGHFAFLKGAIGLFLKGKSYLEEVEEAHLKWSFQMEYFESLIDSDGRIVKIFDVKPKA